MPSFNQPWRPNLDWNTPAGRVIDRLVEALPADRPWQIILFGSSPLQLGIDPGFLSGATEEVSPETFTFRLRKKKLRQVRRREGRYLLRTHLPEADPGKAWQFYMQ